MHHDPDSWITDPDVDHPKGTQPLFKLFDREADREVDKKVDKKKPLLVGYSLCLQLHYLSSVLDTLLVS